jgi:hypothetical protein
MIVKEIIYDIEVYKNRVCIGLLYDDTIRIVDDISTINTLGIDKPNYLWVGFNNRRYDHPILKAMREKNLNHSQIYEMSKRIISNEENAIAWNTNIVDLWEICPQMARCSLKEMGHRLGYETLQNLPYRFDKELTDREWDIVKRYNIHDLRITKKLWDILKSEYEARQTLKLFFDVKTEFGGAPRLAEKVILSELGEERITYDDQLKKQDNLILSENLKALYDEAFSIPLTDYNFDKKNVDVNGCICNIRVGGIHGKRASGVYEDVYEYDVVSYYPSIILNCKLGSDTFRRIYQEIYDLRLELKRKGDKKANSLKLVLNSLYGKMKDHAWASPQVYSPNIALTICLLGQFYMVDLIEKLNYGQCLIANTDGIICNDTINQNIIDEWETRTGFKLECTHYKKIIIKDVNSYYAISSDGKEKRKNEFINAPSWDHNIKAPIIQKAVINKIIHDIPVERTIKDDISLYNFCFFRKAKHGNHFLLNGKVMEDSKVRFYMSVEGDIIENKTEKMTIKLVKDSYITLAMNLKEIKEIKDVPAINYNWYIDRANDLINKITCGD